MSAGWSGATAALRAFFLTGWGGTTRVAMPGDIDASTGRAFEPSAGTAWARLTITGVGDSIVAVAGDGDRRTRKGGLVTLQVFTPAGSGDGAGWDLGNQAADLLRRQHFDGVRTYDPVVTAVGRDPNGWWLTTVRVRWTRDEYV